ncbi:MAG: 3-hydroxyacyl-ACP dehydratase FabZ [Clostridiales bacterium]|nr:3-hydroxyacyl-ACP dehydratase FabZ [Clostridiales bacterium]
MKLDIEDIKAILPHRYPFLMVDRILDMEPGKFARGIKCVSANEMQFIGHFPKQAIMPGVLILEALAQAGACAILSLEENRGRIAVFGGVKNCRFRGVVVPGDVLELFCEITGQRGAVGFGHAVAKVNDIIVCEGDLSFSVT